MRGRIRVERGGRNTGQKEDGRRGKRGWRSAGYGVVIHVDEGNF